MTPRSYAQGTRARTTQKTRRAAIEAAQELYERDEDYDPSLERIAERAGVSTRTLLRHFGSKTSLIEAAVADAEARVARSREAPAGDLETAVRRLVDHYEELGDDVLRQLRLAEQYPMVRRITESGTRMHIRWVEEVFAPGLAGLGARERKSRLALLSSVTDVHVWGILRRRHRLSKQATVAAIGGLVSHARGGSP